MPIYKVERRNYGADNGYDLESGIQVTEPKVPFVKKMFGRVEYSGLRIIQSVESSVGAHLGNNSIQCGSIQGKESDMIFPFHHNALKDDVVPVVAKQS